MSQQGTFSLCNLIFRRENVWQCVQALLKCGCYTVTGAGKGHKVAAKHTHEIVAVVLSV